MIHRADLGQQPDVISFPVSYHPVDHSFTKRRLVGGMYEDTHFTTEVDKDPTSLEFRAT